MPTGIDIFPTQKKSFELFLEEMYELDILWLSALDIFILFFKANLLIQTHRICKFKKIYFDSFTVFC